MSYGAPTASYGAPVSYGGYGGYGGATYGASYGGYGASYARPATYSAAAAAPGTPIAA